MIAAVGNLYVNSKRRSGYEAKLLLALRNLLMEFTKDWPPINQTEWKREDLDSFCKFVAKRLTEEDWRKR